MCVCSVDVRKPGEKKKDRARQLIITAVITDGSQIYDKQKMVLFIINNLRLQLRCAKIYCNACDELFGRKYYISNISGVWHI